MVTFTLQLQDASHLETIDDTEVFVGEDASGSFSILAHHTRLMTSLVMGLARFRRSSGPWQYLAVPEAVIYFRDNTLTLSTRKFLLDEDYERISGLLRQQLLEEEARLHQVKSSLMRMEEEVFKRLWDLGHGQMAGPHSGGWQP